MCAYRARQEKFRAEIEHGNGGFEVFFCEKKKKDITDLL